MENLWELSCVAFSLRKLEFKGLWNFAHTLATFGSGSHMLYDLAYVQGEKHSRVGSRPRPSSDNKTWWQLGKRGKRGNWGNSPTRPSACQFHPFRLAHEDSRPSNKACKQLAIH